MTEPTKHVVVDYTNWRGERRNRRIWPTGRTLFINTEWHGGPTWLIEARDLDTDQVRLFAIRSIHQWSEGEPTSGR